MNITFLGHAGFCVETEQSIIIMDPWFSESGAFDCAWFPYPNNQNMRSFVEAKLAEPSKDKYLYISHEHQDHFDIAFLASLKQRDFTLILANFDHPIIKIQLDAIHWHCSHQLYLDNNQSLSLKDGTITLFTIDTELNCDSAILVQSQHQSFLNINDCKLHDRLHELVEAYGPIDVFAAQFSGASWYPTCYKMAPKDYAKACQKKILDKFEATAKAIQTINPRVYIPSAGPPCFLDPMLLKIQMQPINTYPHASKLIDYLNQNASKQQSSTRWDEVFPGDTLDVATRTWLHQPTTKLDFKSNINLYTQEKINLFKKREQQHRLINPKAVFKALKPVLEDKLQRLSNIHTNTLLYWCIQECPKTMYCINLTEKTLQEVKKIKDPHHYYKITAPAWQVHEVLTHKLRWSEFALTFRVQLERAPDVYDTIIHGFLLLDTEKIDSFCKKMTKNDRNQERIVIEHKGKKYSILRYCPHQGADLSKAQCEGSYLVCPRHQWKFDLEHDGQCTHNESSIHAICIQKNQ